MQCLRIQDEVSIRDLEASTDSEAILDESQDRIDNLEQEGDNMFHDASDYFDLNADDEKSDERKEKQKRVTR